MISVALLRTFLTLPVVFFVAGCVTARTGFDYAAVMQKVGPPRAGQSRIVVLSDKAVADLLVGGVPTKQLRPGTYVYADQPAGRHQIIGTQSMFPGETKYDITTAAGRTYFLLARTSSRMSTVTNTSYSAGLAGALLATALTAGADNPGPVDLIPLDDTAVRTTLAELQLAE